MGNLNNLYISQSFQSLAHLGTDTSLVPGTMTVLQDGIGQSLNIFFDGTNISSSGNLYAANITASVINTGSFATTGSNTFVGANIFSSSVDILGGLNLYQNGIYMGLPKQMGDPYDTNILISTPKIVGQSGSGNRLILTGDTMTSKGVTILNGLGITGSVVISPLPGMTPTGGDLDVYGTFTSSLQNGYIWVGNSSGKTTTVATSSLVTNINTGSLVTTASFNAYTQSNNQRVSSLEAATSSYVTETESGSFLITASVNVNVLTFTKGNGSTFDLTVQASGSAPAGTISSSAQITALGFLQTSSFNQYTSSNDQRVNSLEVNSASVNTSITNINSATQSLQSQLATIGGQSGSWITESETGSFARYDVSNPWSANQTFTNITAVSASFTYVQTIFETASVIYSSGSNQFGDAADDTQTLYGAVKVMNALTASGLNYPTADNGAKSFIQTDGAGNLSLQYVDAIFETVRNMSGVTLTKGTPVYISGSTGDNGNAYVADASDTNKMPAMYILGEDLIDSATGIALVSGLIEGVNTSGYPAGTQIYVAEGGGWSANRPSGSTSIVQKLGVVTKDGIGGQGVVINQLEAELPNLQTGYIWVGNDTNQPIAISTGSFVKEEETGSLLTTASFNAYTQSTDVRLNNLELTSASLLIDTDNLELFSASALISINSLNSKTGSYATTGSNVFVGNQTISGSLIQSGSNSILAGPGGAGVGTHILNRVLISGPDTGDTPRLYISGSDGGFSEFGRGFINQDTTKTAGLGASIFTGAGPSAVASNTVAVYNSDFSTDIELQIFANSSGVGLSDWDNGTSFNYVPFMTLTPNNGNNPAPVFTRGLEVTGSTNIAELTASLQTGYVWVGNASGRTTTVATSSFGGGGAAFPYTGSAEITGSLGITGSLSGFVNALTIASNTASLDFSRGNFFTLQLVSGSITHLTATNIKGGQTINLLVKTDSGSAAATGSLTFSSTFKFAGGFDYTPTAITASQDLVSFVTFDTTQILASQVKNLS